MSKPTITASWDWFYNPLSADEQRLSDSGAFGAAVAEDGDEDAATELATKNVTGDIKIATYDPCVGDCIMVVAWDANRVDVIGENEDSGWQWPN